MATHHQPASINISSELLFLISLINLTKLLNLCYAFFQHNFNLLPVLLLSELKSILSMSFKLSLVHVIRKLYVWTTLHIYLQKCHFLFDLPIFTFSSSSILFCNSAHLGNLYQGIGRGIPNRLFGIVVSRSRSRIEILL